MISPSSQDAAARARRKPVVAQLQACQRLLPVISAHIWASQTAPGCCQMLLLEGCIVQLNALKRCQTMRHHEAGPALAASCCCFAAWAGAGSDWTVRRVSGTVLRQKGGCDARASSRGRPSSGRHGLGHRDLPEGAALSATPSLQDGLLSDRAMS